MLDSPLILFTLILILATHTRAYRALWYTRNMNTTMKQPHTPITPRGTVPKEWKRVAGMLKGRLAETPLAYQRHTRKEWDACDKRSAKRSA